MTRWPSKFAVGLASLLIGFSLVGALFHDGRTPSGKAQPSDSATTVSASGAEPTRPKPESARSVELPLQPRPPLPSSLRAAVLDAPDPVAAVLAVRHRGRPEERAAAADLLSTCLSLWMRPGAHRSDMEQQAADTLRARCDGIYREWLPSQVIEMERELRNPGADDTSTLYGQTMALWHRVVRPGRRLPDGRDLSLLDQAIASGDLLLLRHAAVVLTSVIADGSPDSVLRSQALEQAFRDVLLQTYAPPSQFDAAADCANLGRCDQPRTDVNALAATPLFGPVREQTERQRLSAAYAEALRRGLPASELLAIR